MRLLPPILLLALLLPWFAPAARAAEDPCTPRWSLPQSKLKDHTIFEYDGFFYIASIHIPLPHRPGTGEKWFAYARSADFCHWESLPPILGLGPAGSADDSFIWAPHVIEEGGTYYLFYTGVNRNIAQTMMLATSHDPANPSAWIKRGEIFRPTHAGAIYPGPQAWSDNRDPMLLTHQGRYYLYYTGLDTTGGIVGVAVADALLGPWQDLGPVLREPLGIMPESPFVLEQGGLYYLTYNRAVAGGGASSVWRWSTTPFGPWSAPRRGPMGWAHDFARDEGGWLASYVLGDGEGIAVSRVRWGVGHPPPLLVGRSLFLPLVAGRHEKDPPGGRVVEVEGG